MKKSKTATIAALGIAGILGAVAVVTAPADLVVSGSVDAVEEIGAVEQYTHSICFLVDSRLVVTVQPKDHEWGPAERVSPFGVAQVELPAGFEPDDVPLQRWEYREGEMVWVPGMPDTEPLPDPVEPPGGMP